MELGKELWKQQHRGKIYKFLKKNNIPLIAFSEIILYCQPQVEAIYNSPVKSISQMVVTKERVSCSHDQEGLVLIFLGIDSNKVIRILFQNNQVEILFRRETDTGLDILSNNAFPCFTLKCQTYIESLRAYYQLSIETKGVFLGTLSIIAEAKAIMDILIYLFTLGQVPDENFPFWLVIVICSNIDRKSRDRLYTLKQ